MQATISGNSQTTNVLLGNTLTRREWASPPIRLKLISHNNRQFLFYNIACYLIVIKALILWEWMGDFKENLEVYTSGV
jgi:hypothetical protein